MTRPKHTNPSGPRTARAPYNFVPLPEKALPAPDELLPQNRYYPGQRHTGYIECQLTTSSPLYTRCGISIDQAGKVKAKDQPDFFTNPATEEPTIPGSGLRGMFRTLVEIAGHSKLTGVTGKQLFFRTVDDSHVGTSYRDRMQDKVMGGILHIDGDHHEIEPCAVGRVYRDDIIDAFGLRDWFGLYRGNHPKDPNMTPDWKYQYHNVWVALHQDTRPGQGGFRPVRAFSTSRTPDTPDQAILVLTGNMIKKKKEFVFVRSSHQRLHVHEDVIKDFRRDDQITQWQERAFPTDQPKPHSRRKSGGLRNQEPVFYVLNDRGEVEFLGRAGHFRLPYKNSPRDMVPEDLREEDMVDLAEAIFGYVDLKTSEPARGGRVFFTDATLVGPSQDIWHDEIAPKVLSGPKPTSIQLYLTQREPDDPKLLSHYDSDPEHESTLRGYKLYWHQGDRQIEDIREDPDRVQRFPKQYTRIRPVKTGVSFRFAIHFENLSNTELGALLWILKIAGEPGYRLKLGMGKPLGLGSVQISEGQLHLTDRCERYARLFDDNGQWSTGEQPADSVAAEAVQVFADMILNDPVLNPDHAVQRLEDVPRIHTLLIMLRWPGPDPARTTYMTDLREDFARRKVLPMPEVVAGEPVAETGQRLARAERVQGASQRSEEHRGSPTGQTTPRAVGPQSGMPPSQARATSPVEPRPTLARRPSSPAAEPVRSAPPKRASEKPLPKVIEAEVMALKPSYLTLHVEGRDVNVPFAELPEPGFDERDRQSLYSVGTRLRVENLGESSRGKIRVRVIGFVD